MCELAVDTTHVARHLPIVETWIFGFALGALVELAAFAEVWVAAGSLLAGA